MNNSQCLYNCVDDNITTAAADKLDMTAHLMQPVCEILRSCTALPNDHDEDTRPKSPSACRWWLYRVKK